MLVLAVSAKILLNMFASQLNKFSGNLFLLERANLASNALIVCKSDLHSVAFALSALRFAY